MEETACPHGTITYNSEGYHHEYYHQTLSGRRSSFHESDLERGRRGRRCLPPRGFSECRNRQSIFAEQTYTAVAEDTDNGKVLGLYILHPNNIGRCSHICNASYAVSFQARGLHIGEKLVSDCLIQGKLHGFRVLQFNAVVASNIHARHLYERLGFIQLGVIPGGFRMKDGHYEDICPYYHEL